jgi:hypothetical protein
LFESKAIASAKFPLKMVFPAKSPEASGPLRQFIIPRLLLCVGQPRQHSRRGLPGNLAVRTQVPHGVPGPLELTKNSGDQVGSGAAGVSVFDVLIFDIHPETKNSGHAKFHRAPPAGNRNLLLQ